MRLFWIPIAAASLLITAAAARPRPAQDPAPKPPSPPASQAPAASTKASPPQKAKDQSPEKPLDADQALQRAVAEAANDRAALVRKLEEYLKEYPDAPRKSDIYRALVEASEQLQDFARALEYSERLVAIHPDDNQMMLVAASLLERLGDEHSLAKAVGYLNRVIDRIEKTEPAERPARVSVSDWERQHDQLRSAMYVIRGRVGMEQRNYPAAKKDFETSYSILPNAAAALWLGDLAEIRKDCKTAIDRYLEAFVLPEKSQVGAVDHHEVRQKLGNCWRQIHGTEAGLGDAVLAAYDRVEQAARPPAAPARNKDAKEALAFVLRRPDGAPEPLAPLKGKIIVLSFWATWCAPCRELEPEFSRVAQSFAGKPDVVFFAVNTDEDETRVQPYLTREKIGVPVVLADGLDDFLQVKSIPTVLVLDRTGQIIFRAEGYASESFAESLTAAIETALGATK
jgi:cytochrome c biogenesis protein CcmG/thiol:disulfide interchange protein DsbE